MKTSSLAFLTAMFSLIAFASFVSTFPDGINMAEKHSVECKSCDILFYGGMKGNGSVELYSKNVTIIFDNETKNASYLAFRGFGNYEFPSIIYENGKIYCKEAKIEGKGYINVEGNKKAGKFSFILKGNIAGNISILHSSFIKGGSISQFLNSSVNESIDTLKMLDLLPISIDNIFYLKGNEGIDGINGNGSLIFRGTGKMDDGKLKANSYLIIKDGKFLEDESKIKIAIFYIPYKIAFIWIVSLALFVISLFIKKELEFDKKFSYIAPILSLFFIALTAYMWEKQSEIIFGVGFPSNLDFKGILTLIFIIVPYMEIIALIEFPLRIAISSAFSIFGLHHIGKAFGVSIAYPVAIFLGIKMLAAILNMIFLPFLRLL